MTTTAAHPRPTFPNAFVPLPRTSGLAQMQMIVDRLNTLRKSYARHHRWLESCAVHMLGGPETNPRSMMPSKDAKHRTYSQAYSLTAACGWDSAKTRCMSLDDISELIGTVESIVRAH